jgi:hypothetical protein
MLKNVHKGILYLLDYFQTYLDAKLIYYNYLDINTNIFSTLN